ncbi:MAG: hypothetical protein IPL52_05130 [Flavobacteriales bacterium]|nr:hypothetical protein [Flavobacteriales bacterium]
MRQLLFTLATLLSTLLSAQTYYYIDEIEVIPAAPTTADDIAIALHGNLSSSGAYVVGASANVVGSVVTISIVAADPGGLAVLVPHIETVPVGQLPAGTYTIVFNASNVADFAPSPQHQFVVVGAGSPCDSVQIESVRLHAFSDTAIVVHVLNNSSQLFDYPNFVLFDEDGDTLAVETVNFFGIAGDSWHILAIVPNATTPLTPYYGALHLWTGFSTVLACEWLPFIDLCPPEPCATLIPAVQNMGGALAIGSYSWSIFDADFAIVGSGTFTMTDVMQYDADTICLPPGEYQMACYAQQPPTGGAPVFNVSTGGWISGPSQPVSFDLPALMPFSFYLPCADGTNGIAEGSQPDIVVRMVGSNLILRRVDGSSVGDVALVDALGRLVQQASSSASEVTLNAGAEARGLYLLRTRDAVRKVMLNVE